ncbi:Cyp6g1 family protein [Megaselia abdita]
MFLVALSLVILFGAAAYLYMRYNLSFFKRHKVVHFDADPIFGHFKDLIFMKTSPAQVVSDIYNHKKFQGKPYGGVFVFQTPGIFVTDIDLAKRILMKDANKFIDHYGHTDSVGDHLGINNLFFSKGGKWKQIRNKMVQAFTSAKMKSMFPLIEQVGNELDKYLSSLPLEKGKSTNREMKPIFSFYTMDVIATAAFGIEANTLNNPDSEFYKYGKTIFDFNFFRAIEFNAMFFLPCLVKLLKTKLFGKKAEKFLREMTGYALTERIRTGVIRNDLIDILVELKKANVTEKEFKFTDDALVAQVATFFSAGFETSSQTMTFIMYELAKNPDVQTRLREEIRNVLKKHDGKVTYDVLSELEYMSMVIQETLRLYPVLPFLDRAATFENPEETYSLEPYGDFKITHGMPVFVPVYAIHKDPNYFPDPERFDPERFSSENKGNIRSGTHFPFGNGPRVCIGERFAMLKMRIGLFYFLKNHYVRPNENTQKVMKLKKSALLLQSDGGVFLDIFRDPMDF